MQIQVKNVSKSFGKLRAVNDVSMTVSSSEIVCLLGPSGAGKTTLLRMMIGALKIDSGEILIGGVKIPNLELMKKVGFMPQEDALYTDLTAADNLAFFGGLYGIKGAELKKRADECLALLNLSDSKNKLVSEFSGGMKKRLSLAVVLLHDPDFLLLDEPTVGIDPILRKTIWERFYELKEKGKIIIVTTHVMDEAQRCDRTALIYDGKLIYDDKTDALIAKTPNGNIEQLFFMAKEASK